MLDYSHVIDKFVARWRQRPGFIYIYILKTFMTIYDSSPICLSFFCD